jgi:hypothetical protein
LNQSTVRFTWASKAALVGALLLMADIGWATNTACAGTYDLAANSNGLVAGGGSSGGCEIVDSNFTGFSFTQGTGPAGSNISVAFFGSLISGSGDSSAQFNGGWAANMTTTTSETATIDNANLANPPPAGTQYAFTGVTLGVANLTFTGDGAVVVFEQFCLDSATFNCTSTSGNYGYIQLVYNHVAGGGEFTCLNAGASSCVVSSTSFNSINFTGYLPGGAPDIAMQTTVTTTAGTGVAELGTFEDFVNITAESPEPATFGLMVVALCGYWLLFKLTKPASSRR